MLTISNGQKLLKHFVLYEDRMLTVTQITEEVDQYVIKLRSDSKDDNDHWQFNGKDALTLQRKPLDGDSREVYMLRWKNINYLISKDKLNDIGEMLQHFMKCILHSSIEFIVYDPSGNACIVNKV